MKPYNFPRWLHRLGPLLLNLPRCVENKETCVTTPASYVMTQPPKPLLRLQYIVRGVLCTLRYIFVFCGFILELFLCLLLLQISQFNKIEIAVIF